MMSLRLNPDGTFTYMPPAGFVGEDSFDYSIVDPAGATDSATVTLNVTADPDPNTNDNPAAGNDLATAVVGLAATTNLLDNDTDPNGEPLTISNVNGVDPSTGPVTIVDPTTGNPAGSLNVNPNTGEATFTPVPGFVGSVQVPYTIDDGSGGTERGTITLAIADTPPMAEDDTNITDFGVAVTGNVLDNDTDTNPADTQSIADPATGDAATGPVTITTANGGAVVFNPDGSYEYTPAPGFVGVDTFDYTVIDSFGKTDTGTAEIRVRGEGNWSISGPSSTDEGDTAQYTVSLSGVYGVGEVISIDLGLTDAGTNPDDYTDLLAAAQAAANANPDLSFDPFTGTLSYTPPVDGASMDDLVIDLPLIDDGLIEGPEEFIVSLGNAGSSLGGNVDTELAGASVVTMVGDLEESGAWSVTGPNQGDEGAALQYSVSLTGAYQAGEIVMVDLSLSDIGTNAADYSDVIAAINAAVASNSDVTFDPATGSLIYTAPTDGATMQDIVIDLSLIDDGLIEGPEDFTFALSNASSPTGAGVGINPSTGASVTTINDTQGAGPGGTGGMPEGPGEWSISGPGQVTEGQLPEFTLSLAGAYGAGESVTVDVELDALSSSSEDYGSFIAAIEAAVSADANLSFNSATGTVTFTSPADGGTMNDLVFALPIVNDDLLEGDEQFAINLSNGVSTTGANIGFGSNSSIVVTIQDTQGSNGGIEGPGEWNIAGVSTIEEGETAQYTVSLHGAYGAGEIVNVDISVRDIESSSEDYGDLVSAIQLAAADNPDVTFEPTVISQGIVARMFGRIFQNDAANDSIGTLSYTAPYDGASMDDLQIGLPINDDSIIEDLESYELALSNASSQSGVFVGIANPIVTTSIESNDYLVTGEPEIGAAEQSTPLYVPSTYEPVDILDLSLGSDGYRPLTNVSDNVLLRALNGIRSLDSYGDTTLAYFGFKRSPFVDSLDQALHIQYLDQSFSEGFSSGKGYRGTASIDPTDDCGRIFIDTIVLGDNLAINAHSTIDPERSDGVVGYTATLVDGEPLPQWISELTSGEYVIHRAIADEVIRLKIIAHRDNSPDLVRIVEINAITGLITDMTDAGN